MEHCNPDFASNEELRQALVDFKKSGKWIIAYADSYTQGAYYIASVADKVLLNPSGMLDWHGIAQQADCHKTNDGGENVLQKLFHRKRCIG